MNRVAITLVGITLLIAAYFGYDRLVAAPARERAEILAMSEIVSDTMSKQSALKVSTLSGIVRGRSSDTRLLGLLNSDQLVEAPYTIDYFVDLSKLSARDYRWDREARTLTVRVPDVAAAPANVDESRSKLVQRRGIVVTPGAVDAMTRLASRGMQARVQRLANEPAKLAEARENARDALTKLLRTPLASSGRGDIKLSVAFATEGGDVRERWDESRSIAEVLREP